MTAAAVCNAVDLTQWGPDANPPSNTIGVGCQLELHEHDGVVSIDIVGGYGDRRLLVNSEVLRFALAGAGVTWAAGEMVP